jgi:phosphocarrier protein
VQLASRYPCEIKIAAEGAEEVNAKSVMGVLLLCGAMGTWVQIRATGEGADEAVAAIGELIAERFGERE